MKKKVLSLFFVFCLCLLSLTGCMSEPAAEPREQEPSAMQKEAAAPIDVAAGETLEVYYIDVGQGDAALLLQGGSAMLIDTGERDQEEKLLAALRSLEIDTLDIMVLTHPHTDHMGCAQGILENIPVDELYMTNYVANTKTFENLLNTLQEKDLYFTVPQPGSETSLGEAKVTFLAPVKEYDDCNDSSIALKVTFGENSFLFTGDAEVPAELDILDSGADVSAQVLQAGHHGSSTSTCNVFFEAVDPEIAVISCGQNNDYGHPHDETLELFEDAGISVYRTDLEGTILLVSDGKTIERAETPDLSGGFSSEAMDAAYVGNINSKVLHTGTCGSLPAEENRVYFSTLEAALNSGYKPHSGCIQ